MAISLCDTHGSVAGERRWSGGAADGACTIAGAAAAAAAVGHSVARLVGRSSVARLLRAAFQQSRVY